MIADPDSLEYVVHRATSLVVISFVSGASLPFFCKNVNDDVFSCPIFLFIFLGIS
jgi:hypothetical protein